MSRMKFNLLTPTCCITSVHHILLFPAYIKPYTYTSLETPRTQPYNKPVILNFFLLGPLRWTKTYLKLSIQNKCTMCMCRLKYLDSCDAVQFQKNSYSLKISGFSCGQATDFTNGSKGISKDDSDITTSLNYL